MFCELITGKTKQTFRINKPVGGILIRTNQMIKGVAGALAGIDNEVISIVIESGNKQTKVIQPRASLLACAAIATIGEGAMFASAAESIDLYIPIADGGSLDLGDNDEIVVTLENLKSAKEYECYGEETPGLTRTFFQYDQVTILAGRPSDIVNLTEADAVFISNRNSITRLNIVKLSVLPDGNLDATNHKFEGPEIDRLMAQTNDFVVSGAVQQTAFLANTLALPVGMVTRMEVELDTAVAEEHTVVIRKPMSL